MSNLPLNLPDKVNSPFLEEWLQKYGADKYLSAQDFNRLRDAINELFSNSQNNPNLYYGKAAGQLLEEILAGMASGQKGIYYDSIEDAMAVDPLPENGVPFCVKPSNESESGIYIYNSEATNEMWEKIGDLGAKGEVEEGNTQAVSGNTIYKNNFLKLFYNRGNYVRKETGLLVNNAGYKTTGFLKINHTEDILMLATESVASTPVAFYDENFIFISSVVEGVNSTREFLIKKKGSTGGHVVPETAEYLMANCDINEDGNIYSGIDVGFYIRSEKEVNLETFNYFHRQGLYHRTSGVLVDNVSYKSTEILKLNKNEKLEVLAYKSASSVGGVYFYDSDKNFISSLFDGIAGVISGEVTPPENAEYYSVTALVSQTNSYVKNSNDLFLLEEISKINNNNQPTEEITEKLEIGDLFTRKGYTGNESANSDYNCTDFLPLDLENDLKIRVSGSGSSAAAYAFYDKHKQPLYTHSPGSTDIVDTTILKEDFPEGAVYFRGNARIAVLTNPHVRNITALSMLKMIETKGASDETGRSLKVLNIGSSHGIDMIQSFPILAKEAGVNIKCANLYTGGIGLPDILDNCINDIDFQIYSVNENGSSWQRTTTGTGTRTVLNALQSEQWDIIILQRRAYSTNTWTQLQQDSLFGIIKYITENVDYKPKILFSLGHPPAVGNASTPTLQDQTQWYLDSVAGALEMQKNVYLDIIPTGTAIQNARSTFLKNYGTGENQDLCRDLLHLDTGIGTYITGCLLFEYIIGKRFDLSILTNKFIPQLAHISGILGSVETYTQPTEIMAEAARYCAMAAIQNPYEVSENLAVNFPV
jgi:hypothetical protein